MRKEMFALMLLILFAAGCTQYARIEELPIGMSAEEFAQVETPCYFSGEASNTTRYNCRLNVPSGPGMEQRTIKPYVITFKNGYLVDITLDEKALEREVIRDNYRFRFHYGYHHFRP